MVRDARYLATASQALEQFDLHAANVDGERYMRVLSCQDILGIPRSMMMGKIEHHTANHQITFNHLREPVSKEDHCPTMNPGAG